jgi:hypothetical protein
VAVKVSVTIGPTTETLASAKRPVPPVIVSTAVTSKGVNVPVAATVAYSLSPFAAT